MANTSRIERVRAAAARRKWGWCMTGFGRVVTVPVCTGGWLKTRARP
jgi:hypothetical protein